MQPRTGISPPLRIYVVAPRLVPHDLPGILDGVHVVDHLALVADSEHGRFAR
jgi:hypothetical protein